MSPHNSLVARALKAYLGLLFYLLLIAGAILAVMAPFVIYHAPEIEDADVSIPVHITIEQEPLAGSAARSPQVVPSSLEGYGDLQIVTGNRWIWAGFLLAVVLGMAVMVFVLHQLRLLMRTVSGGDPFHPDNARRIRLVGWVVIASQLIAPLVKYLAGSILVGRVSAGGVTLRPPVDFRIEALFLGMAILVLAEVFRQAADLKREAAELKEDRELTI